MTEKLKIVFFLKLGGDERQGIDRKNKNKQ
jgi:hypothetical protein